MSKNTRVTILINAKDRASRILKKLRGSVTHLGGALKKAAKWGAILGSAALVATLGKAASAAASFGATMAEVSTLVDTSAISMENLSARVLEMTKHLPQSADDLGSGLYQVFSAGIQNSADAMFVLEESAKAAVGGVTDTFTAVDAATTAINAWGMAATDVTRVNDIFFTTVKEGKITFSELATNIGTVATSAALAGVSLEEVGAAMATMTKFGIDAAEASSSMNRLFLTLTDQTDEQAAEFAKLGIEFNTATVAEKGFAGLLEELNKLTGENIDALSALFPNIRAARSAFVLAGKGNAEFNRILGETNDALGASQTAYEKMAATAKDKFKVFKNNVSVVLIETGQIILEAFVPALEKATHVMSQMGTFVTRNREHLLGFGKLMGKGLVAVLELFPKFLEFGLKSIAFVKDMAASLVDVLNPAWIVFKENIRLLQAAWETWEAPTRRVLKILVAIGGYLVFLAQSVFGFVIRQLIDFKFGWERIWLEVAAVVAKIPTFFKIAMAAILLTMAQTLDKGRQVLLKFGIDVGEALVGKTFDAALAMGEEATAELKAFNEGLVQQRIELENNRAELLRLVEAGEGFRLRPAGAAPEADTGEGLERETPPGLSPTAGADAVQQSLRELSPFVAAMSEQLKAMWQEGDDGARMFGEAVASMAVGFMDDFGSAVETAFAAWADGSESAAKAFSGAMLKAIAGVASAQGQLFLAEAAAAVGRGLATGNPSQFAAAAKFMAAAAGMFALAGAIGGSVGGGGGGGGGGAGSRSRGLSDSSKGEAVLVIEGGILDMGDPRQEEALRSAMEDLSDRRVVLKSTR